MSDAVSGSAGVLVLTPCVRCGQEVAWPVETDLQAVDPCICTECIYGEHKRLERAVRAIYHYSGLSEDELHSVALIPCGDGPCLLCLIEGTAKAALEGKDV